MHLSFHGGVRGVTGSCFLIETARAKLLVDCGMFQGERVNVKHNEEPFGFSPAEIDAVVVTHAHYDHTGRVPVLVRQGFRGKIYMTPPTKALSALVLEDAQHMMVEHHHKLGDPILFDQEDLKKMLSQTTAINYHTQFEPAPGLRVMFHEAGHILGSAYVSVDVPGSETITGEPLRFIFSGDIGNDKVPILPSTEPISSADVIVTESTYGNRDHEPVSVRGQKLMGFISRIINHGGTLMIPAFSIERTQELLYELDKLADDEMIPDVPIYLDSPLAIKTTGEYRHFKQYLEFEREFGPDRDFFSFHNLHETLSIDESKTINNHHGPKIIIAGSGMMTGGRILHHARRYLSGAKNGLLIIGYQAEGTVGRQIKDGAKEVRIFDELIDVRCQVEAIGAFSAHGDRGKLARWLQPVEGPARDIYLVHGDPETKVEFKPYLQERVDSKIHIPEFQQSIRY